MWVGIVESVERPNRTKRQRKGEFALCLSWVVHLLLGLRTISYPNPLPRASGLGLNYPGGFPGLQVTDSRV